MIDEQQIRKIVESVVASVAGSSAGGQTRIMASPLAVPIPAPSKSPVPSSADGIRGNEGVFARMEDAINASKRAFQEYQKFGIRERERLIGILRRVTLDYAEEFSRLTCEETGMGNVRDKILKHRNCAKNSPGTEDLISRSWSGERGVCLEEFAPFGIIGSITPSTHPVPTLVNNAIIINKHGYRRILHIHSKSYAIIEHQ